MRKYAKTPTVFQMEATECGAASLAMIFGYFGKHLPLEQMRIETGVSRDGCNAANIMRAAKKYGLDCHGYRKEPADLKKLKLPCIIHWNFNHFVVLEGFKGRYAYLNDPAIGRRRLTWQELDEGFTGVVLTFEKTGKFKKEKKKSTARQLIVGRLKGRMGVLFQLFYIGLLLVFPGLVLPVLSQMFMDDVLVGGYTDWMVKIVVFMGCLAALKMGLTYYRDLVLKKLCSKMTLLSGWSFLKKLLRLPISFFDQRNAGDLVERMQSNTSVNEFVAGELAETVLNLLVAIFYLGILLLYSPLMTLIGVISVTITLITVLISNKTVAAAAIRAQMSGGKMYGAICSGLSITDTLKASGAENEYISRILGYEAKYASQEQEMARFQQIVNAIPDAVGKIADVMLLLIGGRLVMTGQLTMGMLLAFNSLFDSFCEPVNSIVSFVQKIQTLKADLNRVEDIEKYPAEAAGQVKMKKGAPVQKLSGDVELRSVSFGYSHLKPALVENFSFKLRSGESIAFVGPSGCGKSTVSKMVSGLYQPWSGEILFDGKKADEYPRGIINTSIATVSQNIVLFSGTIRDNLSLWNRNIPDADLIRAAKDARIYDYIQSQAGGLDYRIIENGMNLSGGQRQRLEIARALATNPTVLIMDEATSALDPIVEKEVMDNIRRRGCTCVIVAHRLSAIRDCDEIVVMKSGKIIQRGTHQGLVQEDGYYRQFIRNM